MYCSLLFVVVSVLGEFAVGQEKISLEYINIEEVDLLDNYKTVVDTVAKSTMLTDEKSKFKNYVKLSYSPLNLLKTRKVSSNILTPQVIIDKFCEILDTTVMKRYSNAFMISSDFESLGNEKAVEFLLHLSSALGIPSFTYMADKIGRLDTKEEPMALRLEPSPTHIAEAMLDFLAAYSWNMVAIVVDINVPGSASVVEKIKTVAEERKVVKGDRPAFSLEITQIREFHGFSDIQEIVTCYRTKRIKRRTVRVLKPRCTMKFLPLLNELRRREDRVFLFHGTAADFRLLAEVAYNNNLQYLFGKEYVWIHSPAVISGVPTSKRTSADETSHSPTTDFTKNIDGMFGFVYLNNIHNYKRAVQIASKVWYQGMQVVMQDLTGGDLSNTTAIQQMVRMVRPQFNCSSTKDVLRWNTGRRLYQAMKKSRVKFSEESEEVGFFADGYVDSTSFVVMNSRNWRWHKVGRWSMSNKWGKARTRFQIDGVTWPGKANKAPVGRPKEFLLHVATLKEEPFVMYGKTNSDGTCDANTIECTVKRTNETALDDEENDVLNAKNQTDSNSNHTRRCCTGLTMDLLKELSKDLNFRVNLFEVPDRKWGGWDGKGWNGLIKVLNDGKADMVVTSLKITPNRSKMVEFSVPFQETGITIVVALREGAISATAFLEPYDYASWCVILVFSVHACGAALFLYEWLSPQGLDRGNVAPREHKFSLFRSLWLIWSMLFGAAVNADNPRGVASRFLASIWALFALVFLASYTANLAAFMIAKESFHELNGIKDEKLQKPWNQKPPFRFATVPSGATEENIRMNFREMSSYMKNYNKSTVDEGIKALKNGDIDAFIYDAKTLEYKVAHDRNCKLRTVGNWYAMSGYGVAFPKNSKWLPKINTKILEYEKHGKLQRWKKFWLSGACKTTRELGNSNKKLGVKNFISAFILLVGGMIFCCILLLLEHAFYRYMRPRLKKWDKYGCCGLVSISMGQLLSFEQSVNQTVDLIKHHKCRNPICETQLWKTRHELDMAQRRLRKLEAAAAKNKSTSKSATNLRIRNGDSDSNKEYMEKPRKPRQSVSPKTPSNHATTTTTNYVPYSQAQVHLPSNQSCDTWPPEEGDESAPLFSHRPSPSKYRHRSRERTPNPSHANSSGSLSERGRPEILYKHPRLQRSSSSVERERLRVYEKESVL